MAQQREVETPKVVRSTGDHQTIHPNLAAIKQPNFTEEQENYTAGIEESHEYHSGTFALE